mgnify:CR=1 FL=1
MSLVKKFMTVGGATLGSRIFGFARETLMAAALGTGPVADVFYAAFQAGTGWYRLTTWSWRRSSPAFSPRVTLLTRPSCNTAQ